MSSGRGFRVYRHFLPLMAAGFIAACGTDPSSFGEPFTAADAGTPEAGTSAGRSAAGSPAAGSGGVGGTGGKGGSSSASVVDAGHDDDDDDKDDDDKEDDDSPKAGRGGSGGSGGNAAGSGGAGGAGGSGGAAAVSFGDIFTGTIQLGCSCHNGGAGGLDLGSRATAYKNLVSVASSNCPDEMRVAPGNPDGSVLVHALNHTAIGSCNVPNMPQGGNMLSQTKLDQIKAWITAGAPDN